MAHFAKVENGVVTDLIVVDNDDCGGGEFPESEPIGQAFIAALAEHEPRLSGEWFQTSYNTRDGKHYPQPNVWVQGEDGSLVEVPDGDGFRWNFGQIGFRFDADAGQYGEFHAMESE